MSRTAYCVRDTLLLTRTKHTVINLHIQLNSGHIQLHSLFHVYFLYIYSAEKSLVRPTNFNSLTLPKQVKSDHIHMYTHSYPQGYSYRGEEQGCICCRTVLHKLRSFHYMQLKMVCVAGGHHIHLCQPEVLDRAVDTFLCSHTLHPDFQEISKL